MSSTNQSQTIENETKSSDNSSTSSSQQSENNNFAPIHRQEGQHEQQQQEKGESGNNEEQNAMILVEMEGRTPRLVSQTIASTDDKQTANDHPASTTGASAASSPTNSPSQLMLFSSSSRRPQGSSITEQPNHVAFQTHQIKNDIRQNNMPQQSEPSSSSSSVSSTAVDASSSPASTTTTAAAGVAAASLSPSTGVAADLANAANSATGLASTISSAPPTPSVLASVSASASASASSSSQKINRGLVRDSIKAAIASLDVKKSAQKSAPEEKSESKSSSDMSIDKLIPHKKARTSRKPVSEIKPGQSTGRWTHEEHRAFLEGLKVFGREWKKVASRIPTRTSAQIRSHAQKYFAKLQRDESVLIQDGGAGSPAPISPNDFSQLPRSVQQTAERIMADPVGAQREVEDTLQALRERYRQLQIRLERQQSRDDSSNHNVDYNAAVGGGDDDNFNDGVVVGAMGGGNVDGDGDGNSQNARRHIIENNERQHLSRDVQKSNFATTVGTAGGRSAEDQSSVSSGISNSLTSLSPSVAASRELGNEELIALHVLGGALPRGSSATGDGDSTQDATMAESVMGSRQSLAEHDTHSSSSSINSNNVDDDGDDDSVASPRTPKRRKHE